MNEVYGTKHGLHIPHPLMMQHAFVTACHIREKDLPKPVQDAYYAGVDLDNVQTSEELTQAGKEGRVALQDCFFDDFLTAEYYRGALRPDKHNPDPSVPLTTPAQKGHVQLLVKAFNNTQDCDDNAQMIKPFLDRRHDAKLVEVLCWGVLKACIMRCNSDEPLLTSYEPNKSRNSPGINTFADRFDEIVKSMTRSKTICKHLYDPPYVNVFVDDPVRAVRRVDANRDFEPSEGSGHGKRKEKYWRKKRGRRAVPLSQEVARDEQSLLTVTSLLRVTASLLVALSLPSLPVGKTRSPSVALPSSTQAAGSTLGAPPLTPLSAGFNMPSPSTMQPHFKQEEVSPRRAASDFAAPSPQFSYAQRNNLGPSSTFGNFEPYRSLNYGSTSPSFNPYTSNFFGTGFGSMSDFFGQDPLRRRHAQYTTQQPGFSYGPMHGPAAASAPTTPLVPGFVSSEVASTVSFLSLNEELMTDVR